MEKKKSRSKSKLTHKCPNCGDVSETKDQFCNSCEVIHQVIIDVLLHRLRSIRYKPLYFYDGVCLYRLWQIGSRRQRVLKRAGVIADWLDRNKHNKAQKEKYRDLHVMFIEFVASFPSSQAEKKVGEMLRVLEES